MLRAKRMTPPSPNSRASDLQLHGDLLSVEAGDEQLADLTAERERRHRDSNYNSARGHRRFRADAHRSRRRHHRHLAAVSLPRRRLDAERGHQPARACAASSRATDGRSSSRSIDTNARSQAPHWSELSTSDDLPLLALLARHYRLENATLTTRGESPAGAGIAGSSALDDRGLRRARALDAAPRRTPEELLQVAMNVECQTIRVPTGVQDYRPALYGGIAAIELRVDGIRRVGLDVDPRELERRIVLAYTGAPRNSGTNNWEITKRHLDGDRAHLRLLRAHPRHGRGDADGASARRLGRGRPSDRQGMGQPQAARAWRHHAGDRRR